MKFRRVVLALSLLAAAPAYAGEVERAEHVRVSEEMRRLAQRNAWFGVDQGYRKLEALVAKGEVLSGKEHMFGAQAAQALGDITSARVRLVRARDAGLAADAAPMLEMIDGNYGTLTVRFDKKYVGAAALVSKEPPFAPDQRACLDYVTKVLATRAAFEGLLPLGPYELDGQAFTVTREAPVTLALAPTVAAKGGPAPGGSGAEPAGLRSFGPRATVGVAFTMAGDLSDAGKAAEAGLQAGSFGGLGTRLGVGAQLGLGKGLGVLAEVGYHDLFGPPSDSAGPLVGGDRYVVENDSLHMGYAWLAAQGALGPVVVALGPTYSVGKASVTGVDGYCTSAEGACEDAPLAAGEGATYQRVEGSVRAAGAALELAFPLLELGSLRGAIALQSGAQTDGFRWYPWGDLAFTVAPAGK